MGDLSAMMRVGVSGLLLLSVIYSASVMAHTDHSVTPIALGAANEAADSKAAAKAKALAKVEKLISAPKEAKADGQMMSEVKELKKKLVDAKMAMQTIVQKTTFKIQALANKDKERFRKKTVLDASCKGQLQKVAKKCAAAMARNTEKMDKYKSLMMISARKAMSAKSAEQAVTYMQAKLNSASHINNMLASKIEEADATIAKKDTLLKHQQAAAATMSIKPRPKFEGKKLSMSANCKHHKRVVDKIKCHRKLAMASHKHASHLHKKASKHHKKKGDMKAHLLAKQNAKASKQAADKVAKRNLKKKIKKIEKEKKLSRMAAKKAKKHMDAANKEQKKMGKKKAAKKKTKGKKGKVRKVKGAAKGPKKEKKH